MPKPNLRRILSSANGSSKKERIAAVIGLIATTAAWGSAFVFMKNMLVDMPPLYLLATRFTFAAIAMLVIYANRFSRASFSDLLAGSSLGFWLAASYIAQTYGLMHTTASNNAFFTALYVVAVPFLEMIMNRSRVKKPHIAAALVAALGVAFLTLKSLPFGIGAAPDEANIADAAAAVASGAVEYRNILGGLRLGDLLSILCGVLFAIHIIILGRHVKKRDLGVISTGQFGASAVICWIAAVFSEGAPPFGLIFGEALPGLIYLSLVCTIFCFLLQAYGQKHLPNMLVSILMAFESVFATVFAVALLGDPMSVEIGLGFALLLIAALISVSSS